jgi:LacI family transcriptional regulator
MSEATKHFRHGKVTIVEVANHLGLHPSTVSRALNPDTRKMVSSAVVKKVAAAAKKLGYVPNSMASALKTGRSAMVGILVPDLSDPVFPPIIRGAQQELEKEGLTTLVASSYENAQQERVAIRTMRSRLVDGLMIATAKRHDPLVEECLAQGIPLVLIYRTVENRSVSAVVNDDAYGIRAATEHLIGLGHCRMAHVGGPQNTSTGCIRRQAFMDAMQANGLEVNPDLLAFAEEYTAPEGYAKLKRIMAGTKQFTAVVAASDVLALGCLDALAEAGLRCPEDVSLTGYNDIPMVGRISPPLTTLRIQHVEMGRLAARTLLELLNDGNLAPRTTYLRPELVIRGSSAKPGSR